MFYMHLTRTLLQRRRHSTIGKAVGVAIMMLSLTACSSSTAEPIQMELPEVYSNLAGSAHAVAIIQPVITCSADIVLSEALCIDSTIAVMRTVSADELARPSGQARVAEKLTEHINERVGSEAVESVLFTKLVQTSM